MSSQFTSLSELVKAVYLEAKTGIKDERLISLKAPTGLNETTNADGGYLVGEQLVAPLLESMQQKSVLYSRATRLTTSSYGAKIPMVNETERDTEGAGTLEAYWIGEAAKKIKDKPQFSQLSLKLHKLVVLMPVTEELMEDSALLNGWIDQFVATKIAWKIDEAILTGDGNTSMYGIMSADTNGVIGVNTPDPLVEGTIQNYVKALAPAAQKRSEWYMSKENYNDLLDINWTDDYCITFQDGQMMLYGMPVNVLEQMNDSCYDIMLGDIAQYCVVTKGDITKAVNISLRYNYDEKTIRWVIRINGKSFGNKYTLADGTEVATFVIPECAVTGSSSSESMSDSSSSSTEVLYSQSTSSASTNSGSTESYSSKSSQSWTSSSSTYVQVTSSSSSVSHSSSSSTDESQSSSSSEDISYSSASSTSSENYSGSSSSSTKSESSASSGSSGSSSSSEVKSSSSSSDSTKSSSSDSSHKQ